MPSKLPLQNERIYAPYKIAALVEVLGEQGIAPEDCLKGSGVEAGQIYDAAALTSVRQYTAICRNAIPLSCSPATPFITGSRLHLSAYGMYGYALMSCLSLRDYFRLGVKYHQLATPTLTIEWTEYPDEGIWTFPDAFISSPSTELRQFLLEQQFMQHVTHLQDVAGRSCPPIQACFSYPAPAHADIYPEYLGCPCYFDQPQCELTMTAHSRTEAATGAQALRYAIAGNLRPVDWAGEDFGRCIGGGVSGADAQARRIPWHGSLARALKMTSRTFRRRLERRELRLLRSSMMCDAPLRRNI